MKNKQLFINMMASIIAFIINMGISFLLTPFIVNRLGGDAYGFIGLINNLISYASIITIALNSMAARYITVSIHKNDEENANIYFNSVLLGNIIMAVIVLVVCIIILLNLNKLLDIPIYLNSDVKIAFGLVSIEFIVTLICSVFGIATFVKNKLYLSSLRGIQANIIRVIVLIGLFIVLPPKIFYVNISTIVMALFIIVFNIYYTKKLMPNIKIHFKYFTKEAIVELIKSGVWNTFSRLSQLLNTGLDLLLANVFLGSFYMGILGISKTIPNAFISFTGTIVNVFAPQLTISYAKNDKDELIQNLKRSFKIMTIFTSLFFAFIVVYSKEFYSLWVPNENSRFLYVLTVLAVFHMPITSGMNTIYNVFTITNTVKNVSMVLLGSSILNAVIIIISSRVLPKEQSIYIIAGTSSLLALLVIILFSIPYAAKCLNLNSNIFMKDIINCLWNNIFVVGVFAIGKMIINVNGWGTLIISICVSLIIAFIVIIFIILDNYERKIIFDKIKRVK